MIHSESIAQKWGRFEKTKMMVQKLESLSQNAAPKHPKKDPSLDFCEFFTGCPEVMGACDFNGLRYLQTIDATTGWVEFRVGSFGLTHRGFFCWGVLTSWFGGVFWPEWFFRRWKWKTFSLKLGISNLHAPISVQARNTNPRNPWLRCWKLASKRNFFWGALLVTFSDFFSSRKVKNFAAIRWPKPLQKAAFLGLGILRPKT